MPDIDSQANSSFGEIASWQRVSYYQQWLDQSARANYPNDPTSASAVQRTVCEGNSGTTYAYFFQFTGTRPDASQWLSDDYTTLRLVHRCQLSRHNMGLELRTLEFVAV